MRILFLLLIVISIMSCKEDTVIKPAAMLRLDYDPPTYKSLNTKCPYEFMVNKETTVIENGHCWLNIQYPKMKATIYLSYREINNRQEIDSLLYDAQKLTYDHTIKAESIFEQPRVDSINKVYGMFYMINGNAATQSQFYVTDSIHHFVNGALYFDAKPNFDSIYPAVIYLRNDIRTIMETIRWK